MSEVKPFNPNISQEEIDRLFRKLKDTRLPEIPVWINKLKNFWQDKYSWPDAQKQVSEWHHFTTEIKNLKVHFIQHEKNRMRQKEAIPLLLVHGWPGAFLSPSRGWTLQDTARIFDVLMKRLGYTSYTAQAGDWGHWVVRKLGSGRYNACKAVHTNMCPGAPHKGSKMNEKEEAAMDRAKWWMGEHLTATLDKEEYVKDVLLCYYHNVRHEVYTEFNAKEENLIRVPLGASTFSFLLAVVEQPVAQAARGGAAEAPSSYVSPAFSAV
ncbi:alpha/beta-hydrolase [Macroventuria anomochaeta]|uniref:Alpha/beta-hydrolase n=1 Tax=Macroventuria anomochaeta TaxID=301207 RepID=A0ACB6SB82_9PLEO|nr:alpha/beta-hydrolase [Macroventuria anomochaeta]KAF2631535.1 alpha/beta-hydrolase [Macroventuria anomochaeta]